MDNELSLDLKHKEIIEALYIYRQMIAESLDYSGHFRKLMESNVRFRVILRRFTNELEPVLNRRLPSYIHKLFDAFKTLHRNRDPSKLQALFLKDQDIFNVYEKKIGVLSDLFSIYSDPKFKLSLNFGSLMIQGSGANVLHSEEIQTLVVANKAKL